LEDFLLKYKHIAWSDKQWKTMDQTMDYYCWAMAIGGRRSGRINITN
jgi:hypothetical protein